MKTRALALACSIPWALTPEWMGTVLAIAARENPSVEAVEAELGRPLRNAQVAQVRDGIAVLPVAGPIFRHANAFAAVSGATSIEVLARDFNQALADEDVSAIVLSFDSPGGEVNGTHEMSAMIAAARGKKPICAYVGGACASAAYWIASACDEIVIDATATLGSIGCLHPVLDENASSARAMPIVSSQSPKKHQPLSTESGRAAMQERVDATADVFVQDVAQNRGVTTAKVLSDFGQGDVLVGAAAVKAGLADRLGSFEGVLSDLRARHQTTGSHPTTQEATMAKALILAVLGATAAAMTDVDAESKSLQEINRLQALERDLLRITGEKTGAEAIGAVAGLSSAAQAGTTALAELAALRATQREGEVTAILASAKGKIAPADRQGFLEICGAGPDGKGADPKKLAALVSKLPVLAHLEDEAHEGHVEAGSAKRPTGKTTGAIVGLEGNPEGTKILAQLGVSAEQIEASNNKRAKARV